MEEKKTGSAMAKVLIYAENGVRVVNECPGPDGAGACPKSQPGALVACAGRKIRLTDVAGSVGLELTIEPDAVSCPLAALNVRPSTN